MENSNIKWTTHTFNPWLGCQRVALGCTNCYAEFLMDTRYHKAKWGPQGTRVLTTDAYWKKPVKWDDAEKWNERPRVFCASLADVFEEWQGPIVNSKGDRLFSYVDHNASAQDGSIGLTMDDCRRRLFKLVDDTPNLDWLLLTKRPENIKKMWPHKQDQSEAKKICTEGSLAHPFYRGNCWLGTSIACNADLKNLDVLAQCRELSPIRFASIEPLIEDIDYEFGLRLINSKLGDLSWVIIGAESDQGSPARPCDLNWIRKIVGLCNAASIPCFVKQIQIDGRTTDDIAEFPADLQIQEFPACQ